jgi:hypothetical protein
MWYLLLINPFLDFAFPLPGGQQVLMLDWGKHEEIYNFESAQDWMEFSQRAKNCLIPPPGMACDPVRTVIWSGKGDRHPCAAAGSVGPVVRF